MIEINNKSHPMDGKNLYWVGSRYSDCLLFDKKLKGSICLYGEPSENNIVICDIIKERVDNNEIRQDVNALIREKMLQIAKEDENAMFYFYNPGWKYDIGGLEEISDRLIGVNDKSIYDFYDSKVKTRNKIRGIVNMLDAKILTREECSYELFKSHLPNSKYGYLLQAEKSSGGLGTLIVDEKNKDTFTRELNQKKYILSRYYELNVPVNYHAIIYDKCVLVLPGSIQILRYEDNHLIYKGADYIAYKKIDQAKRKRLVKMVRAVCEELRKDGYRGVVGIDGMLYEDKEAIVEINTRHQGSTAALNVGLVQSGFKTVQELGIDACCGLEPSRNDLLIDDETEIKCSSYAYNNIFPSEHSELLLKNASTEERVIRVDKDGYDCNQAICDSIYKFRLIFNSNICAENFDGDVWVHQNIIEPERFIYEKVCDLDPLAIKITLMTQGTRIDEDAKRYLMKHGGIREGNNNAVDVYACNMIINAPLNVEFNSFTPYSIRLNENGQTELYYYERFIDNIHLYPLDPLSGKRTKSGRYYADIAYLSTDRLRVHMTNKCIYKKLGRSCRFCNIDTEDTGVLIPMEDIIEVVEDYLANAPELKHFLVGGQSAEEHSEKTRVVEIIRAIRERTDKNIYVMSLPFSKQTVNEMKDAGMTELACNIEVYDDEKAKFCMPGKGKISRAYYMDILSYASELYEGQKGVIRSALILGLEPHESFMQGIKELISRNVQPIVSVFRPLPKTDLEYLMMPPATYLYRMFIEAERLCREKGIGLGPDCKNCQNNTLSLPREIADKYL